MVPLVISDYFRRGNRKRGVARDELPTEPIVEIVWFWVLLVFGALFVNFALMILLVVALGMYPFDATAKFFAAITGLTGPACLWGAMLFWWKLTRD